MFRKALSWIRGESAVPDSSERVPTAAESAVRKFGRLVSSLLKTAPKPEVQIRKETSREEWDARFRSRVEQMRSAEKGQFSKGSWTRFTQALDEVERSYDS